MIFQIIWTWLWRLKYRSSCKVKRLALGGYPALSLKEARSRRDITYSPMHRSM